MKIISKKEFEAKELARKLATVEQVKTLFAKSDIIEAFASLNRLDELMNLVKSDVTFEFYWNGNVNIDLNHEITINALKNIDTIEILKILRGE